MNHVSNPPAEDSAEPLTHFGRRSFLKRLGVAGTALAATTSGAAIITATQRQLKAQSASNPLSAGDVAILKFAAANETLGGDFWTQYDHLAANNPEYKQALRAIDPNLPSYVAQTARDERSQRDFLNAYLVSRGQTPVDLSAFQTLPGSGAVGGTPTNNLVNLLGLSIDTSYYTRFRSPGNPDLGDAFPQIATIQNFPTVPIGNKIGGRKLQAVAQAATFHFAFNEQGEVGLYGSFLPKISDPEVVMVLAAINAVEVLHFSVFHSALQGIVALQASYNNGTAVFPNLKGDPKTARQLLPVPCTFINKTLPLVSVARPSTTPVAGAVATVNLLTATGYFTGQSPAFMAMTMQMAQAADAASR